MCLMIFGECLGMLMFFTASVKIFNVVMSCFVMLSMLWYVAKIRDHLNATTKQSNKLKACVA